MGRSSLKCLLSGKESVKDPVGVVGRIELKETGLGMATMKRCFQYSREGDWTIGRQWGGEMDSR